MRVHVHIQYICAVMNMFVLQTFCLYSQGGVLLQGLFADVHVSPLEPAGRSEVLMTSLLNVFIFFLLQVNTGDRSQYIKKVTIQ